MKKQKKVRQKIIFVCTGNTCRSPMAEAALRKELRQRKIFGYSVSSAGFRVERGASINPNSVQALSEAKISVLKSFRPKPLTIEMVREAKIVICMTEKQRRALAAFANVTSFAEIAGREIPDPYGHGIEAYRITLRLIRECLPSLIEKYCPHIAADGEKNSEKEE